VGEVTERITENSERQEELMAEVKAFRAIRPREDLASKIAALPYDVYNRKEAKAEVAKEPYSFLKIDRAETQFPDEVDTYDPSVYQKAHDILWEMKAEGEFVQDESSCYYLYELVMDGRPQTGIVACASIDDYMNGVIKKHENTRADKEQDRIHHVDSCDAQTGPIFLAYRKNEVLKKLVLQGKAEEPVFDFVSPDGITHRGWKIEDAKLNREIQQAFGEVGHIYIADGHHRAASAVKVGLKRREAHPDYDGTEEFNYFLSVLFSEDELLILDYNRVVMDLNGMSGETFREKAAEKFDIQKSEVPVKPDAKGILGMYLTDGWYRLQVKPAYVSDDPVKGLDVSVLQDELLHPVLGIQDPKTDKRIDFVGGIRGLSELEMRVKECGGVAFSMYPTSIGELFAVADDSLLMPPKSTWFEPKLRSGLFIHSLT